MDANSGEKTATLKGLIPSLFARTQTEEENNFKNCKEFEINLLQGYFIAISFYLSIKFG